MEKKLNNINNNNLKVEVVYLAANSETSFMLILDLPLGSAIQDALLQSRILQKFPELGIDIQDLANRVGIFGEIKDLKTILQAGDRIEIYRDLKIDPKLARKKRANKERIRKIKLKEAAKKKK